MLADTFIEVLEARQEEAQAGQQARDERDDFIEQTFEQLDQQFSDLIDQATGVHALLAVVKSPVTETITNRNFATLDKTIIEVRSTLNAKLEIVRFTPALQFLHRDQFGVVEIETIDVPEPAGQEGAAAEFKSMKAGIVMRGQEAGSLVIPSVDAGNGFEDLTAERLESFLETAFVRGN
jgi:hypothetical protein